MVTGFVDYPPDSGSSPFLLFASGRAALVQIPKWKNRRFASKGNALHAMILGVHHVNSIVAVYRQRPGQCQISRLAASAAPAAQRRPVGREFLHAAVAVLRDVKLSLAVERQVVGIGQSLPTPSPGVPQKRTSSPPRVKTWIRSLQASAT